MDNTAIALGTFDGIHIGHKAVLERAVNSGYTPVAVTFAVPPKVFMGQASGCIMTPMQKKAALRKIGFKKVVFLDFNNVKNMTAKDFLDEITGKYNCKEIDCGFNFRFGTNAEGDTEFLQRYADAHGIKLSVMPPVYDGEEIVSSTEIRAFLQDGQTEKANKLMLEPFGFCAVIVHGDARGRTIGFPTVNQMYPKDLVRVKYGVYKTHITIDGSVYNGITNIGVRPTYETEYVSAETYIINFSGDVYGKTADLRLVRFLRPEQKFDSLDELKNAINNDVKTVL